jgi:fructokinase
MDLVCIGEVIMDMFPAEVGVPLADVTAFRPVPGGAPANVSVAAAKLGVSTAFIGKVGDDAFGERLRSALCAQGVDIRGLATDTTARTTLNFMAQPDANNYECLFYRNPGADTRLAPSDLDLALLGSARALHFGSLSLTHEPAASATISAVKLAAREGAIISFDVNYRPTLWPSPAAARERLVAILSCVDVLKVNEAEVTLLTGCEPQSDAQIAEVARRLLDRGPRLCVITLGPKGSIFVTRDHFERVPGFEVQTVDATGCGDSFIGALLSQLLQLPKWSDRLMSKTLREALRFANAAGAITAQTQGVMPALPTAAQVETFLAVHSPVKV